MMRRSLGCTLPAFDVSGLGRPMIKFNAVYDFGSRDGAVLQYSLNDGQTWSVLGKYVDDVERGSGVKWYNKQDIASDPGQQQDKTWRPRSTWLGWW